jgi:hypothetical protein
MGAPYIPRTDSLPDQVCRYFVRLPDEEMLSREISANHNVAVSNVGSNLKLAVEAGYLTLDGSVYSAGPNLRQFAAQLEQGNGVAESRAPWPAKGGAGTPPPAKDGSSPRRASKAFTFDLSTIEIQKGVPLPAGRQPALDWPLFLGKLEVGDSYMLPAEARSALGSAVTKFKKATGRVLSVRVMADGCGVWRVE